MTGRAIAFALLVSAATASAAPSASGSGVHDYVLGRFAWSNDEMARASEHFAGALAGAPDDPVLLRRTFGLAMAAGNQPLAAKLAARLAKLDPDDMTLSLYEVVRGFERRDWKMADAARARLGGEGPIAFAMPLVEAWTLFARGKRDRALALLDPASKSGFARSYFAEHRGHMRAALGRRDEALAAYAPLLAGEGSRVARLRLTAASLQEAAGRPEEARRILDAGGTDPSFEAARARLAAGRSIGGAVTDPRAAVAELFTRIAADVARERPLPIALVMARLATFLDPKSGDAWFVTSDILARGGQADAALSALSAIGGDDLLAPLARSQRAAILQQLDRTEESIALLEGVAAKAGGMTDWARLGEAYQAAERYKDAARAFDRALALSKPADPEHWYLWFARGSMRERAGDWTGAEADLRKAIELAPKQAAALNYLGYAMLDRGERPAEAQALIERAVALRPDDGYIVDSLGWAYFRAGRYAQAVETLERAVAAVPDEPTINDHLGDAYWRTGRRAEARFAWKAALASDPDTETAKRIAAKLDFGLDVATARK